MSASSDAGGSKPSGRRIGPPSGRLIGKKKEPPAAPAGGTVAPDGSNTAFGASPTGTVAPGGGRTVGVGADTSFGASPTGTVAPDDIPTLVGATHPGQGGPDTATISTGSSSIQDLPTINEQRGGAHTIAEAGHAAGDDAGVPTELGPYRIEGELARGGMGMVLRGFHTQLHRKVAIKLLLPRVSADDVARERFMREARATAVLQHPNIVAIHDVTTDEQGRAYLVMDFVEGTNLKALVKRGPIKHERAAEIMRKVCDAVAHAHSKGILHRDIKPDNVLIDRETNEPMLTDFGLAKVMETGDTRLGTHGNRLAAVKAAADGGAGPVELTQAGEVMGTPLYMAPEQVDGALDKMGPATDIYALGAVLYECLTGRPPFRAATLLDLFKAIMFQPVQPPRTHDPSIPESLDAICRRALAKEPHTRYRSAADMAKEMDRYLAGVPVLSQMIRTAPVRRRVPPLVWAVVLLAAGAGLFAKYGVSTPAAPAGPVEGGLTAGYDLEVGDALVAEGVKLAPEPIDGTNVVRLAGEGYADAMLLYGQNIVLGAFSDQQPEAGLAWMEKAADAGLPQAYLALAKLYQQGLGVEPDAERAEGWLRAGAEAGSIECMLTLGGWLAQRDDLPETRTEAREWLEEAIAQGEVDDPKPYVLLARLQAQGPDADHEAAIVNWEQAADLGEPVAMMDLSQLYQKGAPGVPPDPELAYTWLERAGDAELVDAMFALGQVYELGLLGKPKSHPDATKWYSRAANAGNEEAVFRLGNLGR